MERVLALQALAAAGAKSDEPDTAASADSNVCSSESVGSTCSAMSIVCGNETTQGW
jgi:hypothetical protein